MVLDPLKLLIDNGSNIVLIVIFILMIRGDIVPGWALKRERELTDRVLPQIEEIADQLKEIALWAKKGSGS